MPTRWVFVWKPDVGKTVDYNQILNEIRKCIEETNEAVENGWFRSTLTFIHHPILREPLQAENFPRHLLGITLSEEPNKYYLVLCDVHKILEMHAATETLMGLVRSRIVPQKCIFRGFEYRLRNQIELRVGKIVHDKTGALKGVFMEVDYLTVSSIEETRNLMEEYIEAWQETSLERSWPGQFVQIDPMYSKYDLSDHYTSKHTAVQYYAVMLNLAV